VRSFLGSEPAYFAVTVNQTGDLQYQEAPADPNPLHAHLAAAETAAMFAMAADLNYFKTQLESGLKVANTGKKTFRYQDDSGKVTETTFNYSLNETAQHLLQKFEQIAASERAYVELDSAMRFDKLGVNDALANLEAIWLHKRLAAPEQFVPLLDRIVAHPSYMHLVRARAAHLKEEFAATGAAPSSDSSQR
jgi:hypothetical protein